MSRDQENQTFQTASAQNATNEAESQQQEQNATNAIAQQIAQNPYTSGGAYQTATNQQLSNTADVGASTTANQLQTQAQRTGQNQTAANATAAASAQQNERDLLSAEGAATQQRIGAGAAYNAGVEGEEASLAAQEGNAANGQLQTAQSAGQTPSFLDELGQGVASGLGQFATAGANYATCPAEGSLFLMADGSEKVVELLRVGDRIAGIDGEAQTIEEIETAISPVLVVETDCGLVARVSRVHAFALPFGGFTVAAKSLGKRILASRVKQPGKTDYLVTIVKKISQVAPERVFNVMTDGSHTYRADGIWALGVGEAERQVSMERWNEIGDAAADGAR